MEEKPQRVIENIYRYLIQEKVTVDEFLNMAVTMVYTNMRQLGYLDEDAKKFIRTATDDLFTEVRDYYELARRKDLGN